MLTMERNDLWRETRCEPLKHEAKFMDHILIVDDDPIVRHFLHRMLRIQGYDCVELEDGQEAIEYLRIHRPSLIITDHQMPVMTGIQLLERVSSQCEGSSIPAILLTKNDDQHDVSDRVKQLGVHAVLTKPLDYRKISLAVEAVMS